MITRRPYLQRLCLTLLAAVALIGCAKEKQQLPTVAENENGLVQIVENSIMDFYDGPHLSMRLMSKYMRKVLDNTGKTVGYPVKLVTYDSAGVVSSTVLADTGTTDDRRTNFTVWGRVLVTTKEGYVVNGDKLWWNRDTHRVYSDTYVQIQTPSGDIMSGTGLDATENFSSWTFKSNVKGVIHNFRQRAEGKGDEDFFGAGGAPK